MVHRVQGLLRFVQLRVWGLALGLDSEDWGSGLDAVSELFGDAFGCNVWPDLGPKILDA